MPDTLPRYTEGERRLHAVVRAVLSPGIWLVLAAQIALVVSLQWRAPAEAAPVVTALAIFLTATALMLFFYLQAGAFHALTLGRDALSIGEIARGGKAVFSIFLWLTLKAGILLVVVLNVLVFVAMLVTGYEIKAIIDGFSPFFGPMAGILTFVFVYWLPLVFVRREFRLLAGLRVALVIARARLSRSAFLALLVLAPVLVSGFLPADSPVWVDLLVNAISGIMGWIAYIYCVEVLQEYPSDAGVAVSA